MRGRSMRGNREIPCPPLVDGTRGRIGKAEGRNPMMHGRGKSDGPIVPKKLPNKAGGPVAEAVEGRGPAKGNTSRQNMPRTQSRKNGVPSALERVRRAAARDKETRFTALLHHVDAERLRDAFFAIKRKAAPGVDGVAWQTYAETLEENLFDLHARLHAGGYRAKPSRKVSIPKADGRLRSLGIASLEDKIVQRAMAEILGAIYEQDFVGFSYGFRPGRGQHDALEALTVGIYRKKVNWVLDADIRGFFDAMDHGWLLRFLEHRIADKRVLGLVRKWLTAGVVEHGELVQVKQGTPQGATISPVLANVYLHYVFDLWAHQWRRRHASGVWVSRRRSTFWASLTFVEWGTMVASCWCDIRHASA